jgi:hypothetical protein
LKELQVCLGDLNDVVVNKRLSAYFVSSPTTRERPIDQAWKGLAAGRLCGREEARFSSVNEGGHACSSARSTSLEISFGKRNGDRVASEKEVLELSDRSRPLVVR